MGLVALSRLVVCALLATYLGGCSVWERYIGRSSTDAATTESTKKAMARSRMQAEHEAAVGRVGVRVCRTLEVGVGVRDVVRGTVTAVKGERITMRIDDPGKLDHTIGGQRIMKGVLVTDAMKLWVPCV